jgi:DNA-binding NtrC family response regulator
MASSSNETNGVLLSWIARNNDPYRDEDGDIPGPTLTLLFDDASPYQGRIQDAVLLLHPQDREIGENLRDTIREHDNSVDVDLKYWNGDNPTDHRQIFDFLRSRVSDIRQRFAGRELVINVSPGTPAMHTVWMLMAETGFIDEPFSVVQTVPEPHRNGGPATVSAEIGIETFYKAYRSAQPKEVAAEEERVLWDPAQFKSERLQSVFAKARRYASLKVPILILGERGTGKTTLANWIRNTSPYRNEDEDDAWPSVPCGQYDADTMRSELFGYVEGAFTGADEDSEGLLHAADGDTLFLDEIGDISPDLQRLLIRALEDKKFYRVGAQTPEESDFRLLTATNRPLDELRERLDADFMDRISTFVVRMPPLREIPEDLDWLWESVFELAAERADVEPATLPLSKDDHAFMSDQLTGHPLPGNLRELFRVAYHLIALLRDPDYSATPREACEHAVDEGLNVLSASSSQGMAWDVASAFVNQHPLDPMIDKYGSVNTSEVTDAVKYYMATELRRIAQNRNVNAGKLCDKSGRTLLNWIEARS